MFARTGLPFGMFTLGCVALACTKQEDTPQESPGQEQQEMQPTGATPPHASSGFEKDAEGWTVTGDAQADHVEPDYNGMGGDPDGLISAEDDVTGGTWYFQAPSKYLGDASETYGRVLSFDFKTNSVANPFDNFDVVLEGAGLILGFDAAPPQANVWNPYSIQLDESAGWRVTSEVSEQAFAKFASLPAASRAQLQAVLGDLTQLAIRGEFNTGADTGYLDNVKFGAAE